MFLARFEKRQNENGCILVMDDDDGVRGRLRQMLEREGHDVVEACNGDVGLDLLREEMVELVITELLMPDKDGIETIMDLRKYFPLVRTCAISGGSRLEAPHCLDMAKRFGVTKTLAKPIGREALLQAVQECLA